MIFNERLRRLRKERGLTQVQTAEHLSIAWRNYQRLEKDGNAPSFLTFVKAAEFFGVSLDYLAGRTDAREVNRGTCPPAGPEHRIILEAEVEAPEAAEPGERSLQERRLDFYCRAGFRYAGFDSRLFGVHYRLLAAGAGEEPEPGRSRSCWRPTAPCIRDTFPALCSGGSCRSRGAGRSKPADWERPSAVKIL